MALLDVRHILLIANPAARSGARRIHAAEHALAARGCTVDLRQTTASGDAARFARERTSGVDAVFTLGGDGTVMEVLAELQLSGVPVGVIPAGTGNLLARALGVPLDVAGAVAALLAAAPQRFDLGRIEGSPPRLFAFAAGLGIDATMIQRTTAAAKRRWGVLAYVLAAAAAAWRNERFNVRLITDVGVVERDATLTMVANFGSLLGERFSLGPGITPADGLLDVCVYSPRSAPDAMSLLWCALRRDFRPHPRMYFTKVREVTVHANPPRLWQADGEIVTTTGMARVCVVPGAATLLVPHRSARAPNA
ncbi:MAG: diacylglycerol/lipid kinase family protein [Gemmatimonadaceae bacterium]